MAEDFYPYENRPNPTSGDPGHVGSIEYARLVSAIDDGVIRGEPNDAFRVFIFGTNLVIRPGRFYIGGGIYTTDEEIYRALPAPPTSSYQISSVVVYIDRRVSPPEFGVRVKLGSVGGSFPVLSQAVDGLYEVEIKRLRTEAGGARQFYPQPYPISAPRQYPVGGHISSLMNTPPFFQAYVSASPGSLQSGVWTLTGTYTRRFQLHADWLQGGHSSKVLMPHRGLYRVHGVHRFAGVNDSGGHEVLLRIMKNGEDMAAEGLPRSTSMSNRPISVVVDKTIACNRGDEVWLEKRQNGSSNAISSVTGEHVSYFEVKYDVPLD